MMGWQKLSISSDEQEAKTKAVSDCLRGLKALFYCTKFPYQF